MLATNSKHTPQSNMISIDTNKYSTELITESRTLLKGNLGLDNNNSDDYVAVLSDSSDIGIKPFQIRKNKFSESPLYMHIFTLDGENKQNFINSLDDVEVPDKINKGLYHLIQNASGISNETKTTPKEDKSQNATGISESFAKSIKSLPSPKFSIQINKKLMIEARKTLASYQSRNEEIPGKGSQIKRAIAKSIGKCNKIVNWETVEVDIDKFSELIKTTEHAFRCCVKEGGNAEENVKTAESFGLDFDDNTPFEESLTIFKKIFGFSPNGYYPSPSYTPENNKHRLYTQLSRSCNIEEFKTILSWSLAKIEENGVIPDVSCKDASRYWNGCIKEFSHLAIHLQSDDCLDVDKLLAHIESEEISNPTKQNATGIPNKPLRKQTSRQGINQEEDYIPPTGWVDDDELSNLHTLKQGERIRRLIKADILNGYLEGDITELYNEIEHEFKQRSNDVYSSSGHPLNGCKTSIKYDGYNFLKDKEDCGSNSSFTVAAYEDSEDLPTWQVRSSESVFVETSGKTRHGGDYLDYKYLNGVIWKGRYTNGTQLENFKDIVFDIYNDFGLAKLLLNPHYSWIGITSDWVIQRAINKVSGAMFICGWKNASEKQFHYYGLNSSGFYSTQSVKFLVDCVDVLIQKDSPDLYNLSVKEDRLSQEDRELIDAEIQKLADKKTPQKIIVSEYERLVKNKSKKFVFKLGVDAVYNYLGRTNSQTLGFEKIESPIPANVDYVPFRNGLFDTRTKSLIPNEGQGYNRTVLDSITQQDYSDATNRFNYRSYSEYSQDELNEAGDIWKRYLELLLPGKEDYAKYLLNYSIATMQVRANEINQFPFFLGRKGTGKSSYGVLLSKMLGNLSINSKEPLRAGYTHATATLVGKYLWTAQEIQQDANFSLDLIYEITGEYGARSVSVLVNEKNMTPYQTPIYTAKVFDSEKSLKGTSTEDREGIIRRILFILLDKKRGGFSKEQKGIFNKLQKNIDNILYRLHQWLLNQDCDAAVNEANKILGKEEIHDANQDVLVEMSDTKRCFRDNFEITNNPKDYFVASELKALINAHYLEEYGEKAKIPGLKTIKEEFQNYLSDNGCDEFLPRKRSDVNLVVYSGVKLKTAQTTDPFDKESEPTTPAIETPTKPIQKSITKVCIDSQNATGISNEETQIVETPTVETPTVETPVIETPVIETPVIETPTVETPTVEPPTKESNKNRIEYKGYYYEKDKTTNTYGIYSSDGDKIDTTQISSAIVCKRYIDNLIE